MSPSTSSASSPPGRLSRRLPLVAAAILLAVGGGVAAWYALRPPTAAEEVREVEAAFDRLRNSILQGNDEEFFLMHCEAARKRAVDTFPLIRSQYLSSSPAEKKAFRDRYHVTEKEFLSAAPRDLVVRILPWKSGWRDRAELYRRARVKDVRIDTREGEDGRPVREAVVLLDISDSLAPGQVVPDKFLPTIVFVRDPDGWKRRSFFFGE